MKNFILLIALLFVHEAMAVCTTPLSRTNFSPLTVLTSTKLNADLNALYTQVNEFPGDCITNETVTSAKILNGTIVDADISDSAAIARSKLGAVNYVLSSSSGSFSTSSATPVDVTNLSVTITGNGGPIELSLIGTEGQDCYIGISTTTGTLETGVLRFVKNGAHLVSSSMEVNSSVAGTYTASIPGSSVRHIDFSAVGTITYKIQASATSTALFSVNQCKLLAREL